LFNLPSSVLPRGSVQPQTTSERIHLEINCLAQSVGPVIPLQIPRLDIGRSQEKDDRLGVLAGPVVADAQPRWGMTDQYCDDGIAARQTQ